MKIKAFNVVVIIFMMVIIITNTIIIARLNKLEAIADAKYDNNTASVLHDNVNDTKIENDNTSFHSNDYKEDKEDSIDQQNNDENKEYIELSKDNAEDL